MIPWQELSRAVREDDAERVERILREQPELETAPALNGATWLHNAARSGALRVMECLVRMGMDVNRDAKLTGPPLSRAAVKGHKEAVRWLLANGAQVNGFEETTPPIVSAIQGGSTEIVRLILEAGARTDFTWAEGSLSPLIYAEAVGNREIVNLLRGEPAPITAEPSPEDPLRAHIERHFGVIDEFVLREIVTDLPIDILVARPAGNKQHLVLATAGMSSQKVPVAAGERGFERAELIMYLPHDWALDKLDDPRWSWPVEWLRQIAHHVHEQEACIGQSGLFSTEEPPEPVAPNSEFCALLAHTLPGDEGELHTPDGAVVGFYIVFPIYREEYDIVEREGIPALLKKFMDAGISMVARPGRPNAAKMS